QKTGGTVAIDGTSYGVSDGIAWFDHQWGGSPVAQSGPTYTWSGWCWFEFQFDGGRSLTLSVPHDAIVGGQIAPSDLTGFGTFIDNGTATFVAATMQVLSYQPSPNSDARYPSGWTFEVANLPLPGQPTTPIALVVKPLAPIQPQTLYFASLVEYSEANNTVTATGTIGGSSVALSGVGYCEGVGFENPAEYYARAEDFLMT
ncbi:MAG: carotenoid 1,2-hydratase, partial [Candidatus Eremiobacteraeota bacterium]|nr:carotenoid 1,2-hydratase [Candidatus Eremiobacteraeota bacterium]